jgi:light-regulated signal transduction histidine kinase (bacteriophytochrome)
LARLSERVSTEHDYTLKAVRRGNDELGALCDRFNSMLAEIQRRDAELSQSNNELLRSNDELRQFAFVASHDLQEPLRSITSFCNLLKEDYQEKLGEQADDYIARIVKGSQRMKDLVTDLLAYSRVERAEQLKFQPVDFRDVVADALANLESAIDETGAEIVTDSLPTVVGDRVQLVQLVQNLVGNALKYRSDEPPRIQIDARRRRGYFEFSVRDNGIGIAPEHHQQVFEIFKRLHGRDRYPGTGIGLAVCRKIVQRHGGQIVVDSQLGMGSVFRFTINTQFEESADEHEECLAATV